MANYDLKALVTGGLRLSASWEQRTCDNLLQMLNTARDAQGWFSPGVYRPDSYLWKRYLASREYEGDYTHRIAMGGVFTASNMSLGLPTTFVDKHHFAITQDMLTGDNWFGTQPTGPEDQNPAIKLWERYLQDEAKGQCMQQKLKKMLLGVLKRGEAVYKCTDKVVTMSDTVDVRVMVSPDAQGVNQPVKDTRGNYLTELDMDGWEPDPMDPSRKVLLRDPKVSIAANATPELSATTMKILVVTNPSSGCSFDECYWGDVAWSPLDPDIRQSDFVGHVIDLAPDDLAALLPPAQRTPAFDQYYEECLNGNPGNILSDAATALLRRGEVERVFDPASAPFAKRRYVECWARVETTEEGTPAKDRRREDIQMLIDIDEKRPIGYDYRRNAAPWLNDRRNPFGIIRINPLEERAHGIGYYEQLKAQSTQVDKDDNRIAVAISSSGNQIFRDRTATEEGKAGMPIEYRTLRVNTLVTGRTAEEALSVVSIPCEIKEISDERDHRLAQMQNDFGITTPADAEAAGLPAANTLGGVQILEKQANVRIKQREGEILGDENEGLTAVIKDFSEVSAFTFDPLRAKKLFAPLQDAQMKAAQDQQEAAINGQQPPPLEPGMEPNDNAAVLQQFITDAGDNISDCVVMQVAPKTSSAVIAEAQQAIQVGTQWLTLGAQFPNGGQEMMKPLFELILSKLDVPNPSGILKPSAPPIPPPNQPLPNGQPASQPPAPGPGQAAGGIITPPPGPLPPPQSGQGMV